MCVLVCKDNYYVPTTKFPNFCIMAIFSMQSNHYNYFRPFASWNKFKINLVAGIDITLCLLKLAENWIGHSSE